MRYCLWLGSTWHPSFEMVTNRRRIISTWWTILAGFLSLAVAGLAQSTGVVVGIVRDSVTNTPIPGANARLTGARAFVAAAGPDGRYRIDGVPEGKYKLDAYREGYVSPSATQDLDIHFTSGSFNADAILDPFAILRGRVLDARGQPVEGSIVSVTSSVMKTFFTTITDKDGRFLFKDLSPGSAVIVAVPPRRPHPAPDAGAPRIEMVKTFYPSTIDEASATEIRLVPGDRNDGYDIGMIEERVQRVRGVIRNFSGEPVDGSSVSLQPALEYEPLRIRAWDDDDFLRPNNRSVGATSTNSKGEFEFPSGPAGAWNIHAEGSSLMKASQQPREPTESGLLRVSVARSDIDDVDITLERPFDLQVSFEGLASKAPDPFLLLGIFTPSAGLAFPFPFLATKIEQVSADSLVIHGISPGEYTVESPKGLMPYASSVTISGQEAIGRKVELRAGTPVHITFSNARASIIGSIDSPGGDRRGVSVLLFPPPEADIEPVRYLTAGGDGGFEFAGLRPATYSVLAVREPDVANFSDATLRTLRSRARNVKLEAGATEAVTLTIQAAR